MLFDFDAHEASIPPKPAAIKSAKPEPKAVTVPAQQWNQWAGICSASKFADANTGDVLPVQALELGGYLHAVFSVLYGGFSGLYKAEGWQLVPETMFEGEKWCHANHLDFDESVRERGDYTGMRVSVRGSIMICSKPVDIVRALPTVAPVSPAQAIDYDEKARHYGWRSMQYSSGTVTWKLLNGHPVAVYQLPGDGRKSAVLLWRYEGRIEDYYLGDRVDTDNLPSMVIPPVGVQCVDLQFNRSQLQPLQAGLF